MSLTTLETTEVKVLLPHPFEEGRYVGECAKCGFAFHITVLHELGQKRIV